jgi:spermidine/putrescine transport system permease protein
MSLAFNVSEHGVVWQGFTLKWFSLLLENKQVLWAFRNSLIVAITATASSVPIGIATALGLARYRFPGKVLIMGLVYLPLATPGLILGLSIVLFLVSLGFNTSIFTIILGHVLFISTFVTVIVVSRLVGLGTQLVEAAMDLGANELTTFRKVTFPMIKPAVMAGALLAFTLSLDDFMVTFFLTGPGSSTLPIILYSMLRFRITPQINALSALIMSASMAIALISAKVTKFKVI